MWECNDYVYYVSAQREDGSVAYFTAASSQPQEAWRSSAGQDQEAGINCTCIS